MEFKKRKVKIFILSGKAGSGKDTIANMMVKILDKYHKKAIKIAYASYLKMYAKNILSWDGKEDNKPRAFLQQLGVQLIKDKIDDKMLIRRLLEDIEVYSYFYDVIIISDARFIEEITSIKDKYNDTLVIHVIGKDNNLSSEEKMHITETSLDKYNNYDYEINNVNIDKVEKEIDKIVKDGIYE